MTNDIIHIVWTVSRFKLDATDLGHLLSLSHDNVLIVLIIV